MQRTSLYFTAPYQVAVREEALLDPGPEQVLVQTLLSAISPGTETLLYRGQFPSDLSVDESISALAGEFAYPLKYGYSVVGQVVAVGSKVDARWEGCQVFAFHPHESAFLAAPQELIPVPQGIGVEDAVFLPNMETAVNFLMDGAPVIGEEVVVFGQGIVGLLTAALLARFPLHSLVTLDRYPRRREASLQLGAQASLDPDEAEVQEAIYSLLPEGADLTYELSGAAAALDRALAVTGFAGRVVLGSWYGNKRANLDLGGRFHRSRIRLLSSQVSSLAPEFSGRWTKVRRLEVAWDMLRALNPARYITQHYPLSEASAAYRLLDERPGDCLQVVLKYD